MLGAHAEPRLSLERVVRPREELATVGTPLDNRTGGSMRADGSTVASFTSTGVTGPIESNAQLPWRAGLVRWKLLRVCEFIERNLGDAITVADLANVATLSTGHFSRAFRETVGITPCAFVLERRIARAKTLMMFTQESLSSIAYACGLCDHSHFTRRFTQVVGLSPSRWRCQQRFSVAARPQTNDH